MNFEGPSENFWTWPALVQLVFSFAFEKEDFAWSTQM